MLSAPCFLNFRLVLYTFIYNLFPCFALLSLLAEKLSSPCQVVRRILSVVFFILVLSNNLIKVELPPWKICKADVSSVSPSSARIVYNYAPKGRWIVVDICRDAKRRGIYSPLFTDPEGDSCFSIYQITWIKKRSFNFFFWNFRETTRHFSLRSQNSE